MSFLAAYRRLLLAGAAVVSMVLGVVIFAAHDARHRILQALGPRTTVGDITLDYPTVTLHEVHVAADPTPGAWPTTQEFDARQVEVDITAASLWAYRRGAPLAIADVRVSDGTLSMLRTPGHLTILPALRDTSRAKAAERSASDAASPEAALVIEHLRLDRLRVDLYDATVPGDKPQHLRLGAVEGTVGGLALPKLAQPIGLDLKGTLEGVDTNGRITLEGSVTPAAHDAHLAVRLTGVDMQALQPYLFKLGERSVRHGTLTLAIDASVVDRAVHAPGQLAITGLQFAEDGDGSIAGLQRRALLAALKRDDRIALKFTIDGRTDDPKFSLDENLALRVAGGLGEHVGSGVRNVVEGVGGKIKGLFGKAPARQAPGQ